ESEVSEPMGQRRRPHTDDVAAIAAGNGPLEGAGGRLDSVAVPLGPMALPLGQQHRRELSLLGQEEPAGMSGRAPDRPRAHGSTRTPAAGSGAAQRQRRRASSTGPDRR